MRFDATNNIRCAVKNAIQTCKIQAFALGFIIYRRVAALFLAHVGSLGACTDCTTSLACQQPCFAENIKKVDGQSA